MKSDKQLRQDVEAELEWEPSVDARSIGVAVVDGIVTLTGEVSSYAEKWAAERAVERVEGVRGIVNDIQVKLTEHHTDTDIAKAAVTSLTWNSMVPADRITVLVEDGWLTLKGEVSQEHQRRAAEAAVRYIPGVKGVKNHVTIRPPVEPGDIETKIQDAFTRQASLDAAHVTVELNGSEVTLKGTVRSWVERQEAERAAWAAPGITSVKNLINVNPARAA